MSSDLNLSANPAVQTSSSASPSATPVGTTPKSFGAGAQSVQPNAGNPAFGKQRKPQQFTKKPSQSGPAASNNPGAKH